MQVGTQVGTAREFDPLGVMDLGSGNVIEHARRLEVLPPSTSALSNRATRNISNLLTRCNVCLGLDDDSGNKGLISASQALQTK